MKSSSGGVGSHNGDHLLEEGLAKLGLLNDNSLSLLVKYIEEIELFNPAYGLVKATDRQELIVKHILDSLAPLGIIRSMVESVHSEGGPPRIADAGSGAGLPGIPLAICMPCADFTLIERMGRRAGFLRDVLAILGLSNVRLEEAELEKLYPNPQEAVRFNLIVFRAFKPLEPVILKAFFRLLGTDGALAAYKGRRETIEEEMARLREEISKVKGLSIGSSEALPLDVPFLDEERHLLLIRPGKPSGGEG